MAKLTKEEIIKVIEIIKGEDIYSLAEIVHKELLNISGLDYVLYEAANNGLISQDEFLKLVYKVEEAHSIHMYEMC